jgi:hypothetical protein
MTLKNCIFTDNKICDNCGDCDICDLDPTKVCDNCGKCIGGEGDFASKAVAIDEIIEEEEFEDSELDFESEDVERTSENDDGFKEELEIELIDDIEGLRELLENKTHSEKYTKEEFPGFIRFKTDEK